MSNETRKVDLVGIIFEQLSCGFEPDYGILIEAEELGIDVEAIRNEVDELYPTELQDEDELDFY